MGALNIIAMDNRKEPSIYTRNDGHLIKDVYEFHLIKFYGICRYVLEKRQNMKWI